MNRKSTHELEKRLREETLKRDLEKRTRKESRKRAVVLESVAVVEGGAHVCKQDVYK